ncbi:hypothetical protein Ancab_033905 [Ancistrocladus abbreviatus]
MLGETLIVACVNGEHNQEDRKIKESSLVEAGGFGFKDISISMPLDNDVSIKRGVDIKSMAADLNLGNCNDEENNLVDGEESSRDEGVSMLFADGERPNMELLDDTVSRKEKKGTISLMMDQRQYLDVIWSSYGSIGNLCSLKLEKKKDKGKLGLIGSDLVSGLLGCSSRSPYGLVVGRSK